MHHTSSTGLVKPPAVTFQSSWPSQATQVERLPEPLGPGSTMKVTAWAAGMEASFAQGKALYRAPTLAG